MAPPEPTLASDERSKLAPGAASASASGRPIASPTIESEVTRSRSTSRQIWFGSKLRAGVEHQRVGGEERVEGRPLAAAVHHGRDREQRGARLLGRHCRRSPRGAGSARRRSSRRPAPRRRCPPGARACPWAFRSCRRCRARRGRPASARRSRGRARRRRAPPRRRRRRAPRRRRRSRPRGRGSGAAWAGRSGSGAGGARSGARRRASRDPRRPARSGALRRRSGS